MSILKIAFDPKQDSNIFCLTWDKKKTLCSKNTKGWRVYTFERAPDNAPSVPCEVCSNNTSQVNK